MNRHLLIGALFIQGLAGPAVAQTTSERLEPGSRIRVVDNQGHKTVGTLASLTSDSLIVNTAEGIQDRALALSTVTAVQVSQGRHRQVGKTMLVTMGASAIVFGLLSAASYEPCHPQGWFDCMMAPSSRGSAFAWGFGGGAALGLPLGLLVGLAAKHEQWANARLPGTPVAAPMAQVTRLPGGRIGLGLSIPFGGRAAGS